MNSKLGKQNFTGSEKYDLKHTYHRDSLKPSHNFPFEKSVQHTLIHGPPMGGHLHKDDTSHNQEW